MANIHQRRRARLAKIRAEQAEAPAPVKKAAPKKKATAKKTTKKNKSES